jgi:hypothetical protein
MARTRLTARKSTGGYRPPRVHLDLEQLEEEYDHVVDVSSSEDEDYQTDAEEDPEEVEPVVDNHQHEAAASAPSASAPTPSAPVPSSPPATGNEEEEPVHWTTIYHTHHGGHVAFPGMLQRTIRDLGYDDARIVYHGERHSHPLYADEWHASVHISVPVPYHGGFCDIGVHHAPAFRSTFQAAISDAAREALGVICEEHQAELTNARQHFYPRRPSGQIETRIAGIMGEPDVRLRATVMYMAALNTDLDAALEEILTLRQESSELRARLAGLDREITEEVPHSPPCKRTCYGDPGTRTMINIG